MNTDTNEIRLSGTIDRIREIPTKTGTRMVKLLLTVRRDKFWIIAFKDIAATILSRCQGGDRLSLTGTAGINSWKDDDGNWHNDFQVTAWGVEIHGESRSQSAPRKQPAQQKLPSHDLEQYDYAGGPF